MTKKKVLFLCTGNSCRSQMAEGWARHFHSNRLEVFSAGVEKHGLNKNAVQAMKEAGVDISSQFSKLLSELPDLNFDLVITVCGNANERCPIFPGKTKVVHVPFEDPPAMAEKLDEDDRKFACYRKVRDQIKDFVKNNLKGLITND
ncbi:MAG: arsenate reductase ArsC [Candidatus Rifleibacteriota bacterium]